MRLSLVQRHPLLVYFGLAFGITWTAILILTVPSGIPAEGAVVSQLLPIVFVAMLAGPGVSSVILTGVLQGGRGYREMLAHLARWRVGWSAAAVLITPVLLLIILGLLSVNSSVFVPGIVASSDKRALLSLSIVGGLAAGMFEEIGWTGFATPRLLERHGWLSTGVLIGISWAIWHGLADFWGGSVRYGDWYRPHILLWVVALTAYRVLMTRAYSQTFSLSLAMLLHASFTASQGALGPIEVPPAYDVLWYAIFAAALWLVVLVVHRADEGVRRRDYRRATAGNAEPLASL